MASSHSLYKHPNRKASALQKSVSAYQVKVNILKKNKLKLLSKIKMLRKKETIYGGYLSKLYDSHPELNLELKELFDKLKRFKLNSEKTK